MSRQISRKREAELNASIKLSNANVAQLAKSLQAEEKQYQQLQQQAQKLTESKAHYKGIKSATYSKLQRTEQHMKEQKQLEKEIVRDMQSCQNSKQNLIRDQAMLEQQIRTFREQSMRFDSGQSVRYDTKRQELQSNITRKQQQLQQISIKCYNLGVNIRKLQQKRRVDETEGLAIANQSEFKSKQLQLLVAEKQKLKQRISSLRDKYLILLRVNTGQQLQILISGQATIRDLKKFIYQKHYKQLLPQLMAIVENNRLLDVDQKLKYAFKQKKVKLAFRRAQVWEIQELKADKQVVDQILGEKGVAYMKCGHYYSRNSMRGLIDYQITRQKQHQITCPALVDEVLCNQKFEQRECQLIGGYTQDQWSLISKKLKENYFVEIDN